MMYPLSSKSFRCSSVIAIDTYALQVFVLQKLPFSGGYGPFLVRRGVCFAKTSFFRRVRASPWAPGSLFCKKLVLFTVDGLLPGILLRFDYNRCSHRLEGVFECAGRY